MNVLSELLTIIKLRTFYDPFGFLKALIAHNVVCTISLFFFLFLILI